MRGELKYLADPRPLGKPLRRNCMPGVCAAGLLSAEIHHPQVTDCHTPQTLEHHGKRRGRCARLDFAVCVGRRVPCQCYRAPSKVNVLTAEKHAHLPPSLRRRAPTRNWTVHESAAAKYAGLWLARQKNFAITQVARLLAFLGLVLTKPSVARDLGPAPSSLARLCGPAAVLEACPKGNSVERCFRTPAGDGVVDLTMNCARPFRIAFANLMGKDVLVVTLPTFCPGIGNHREPSGPNIKPSEFAGIRWSTRDTCLLDADCLKLRRRTQNAGAISQF